MEFRNYNVYFFFALLIGVSILIYFILKPLLLPFIIAAILAQFFYPVYGFLLKLTRNRRGLSSGLVCLLVALIIIAPIFFVASLVASEVGGIINDFSGGAVQISRMVEVLNDKLSSVSYLSAFNIKAVIDQGTVLSFVKSISQNTLAIIQSTYRGIGHFVFVSFIMFFSLFYLLIDGERFLKIVMKFSPLKDKYEVLLLQKFTSITRATIKGTSLVAIIQGFIGSLLFLFTGVSSPVLLGILMTISSVIPTVGSGLVWLPVGFMMILLGHTVQGIVILAVGALVIGTVDNILRQKLIGNDVEMHPLLILFSTLGGIAIFGIAGFIVGPIIMALCLALWEIYFFEFKGQLEGFNK